MRRLSAWNLALICLLPLHACTSSAPSKKSTTGVPPAPSTPTMTQVTPASTGLRSAYTFEAERTAMSRGCVGPGNTRPVARVVYKASGVDWFEVSCNAGGVQRVRCDMGMCTPIK